MGPLRIFGTVEASNFKFGTQHGFETIAYQKQRFGPKLAGVWARGASKKNWDPYVFLQPLKLATSNLIHKLGLGLAYQNNVLDQNWRESGLGEHPKKFGTPYLFMQPLKLTTSNLVHKFGLGPVYPKTTFTTKIGGGGAMPGEHPKKCDPLFISATVEASD